ncbi:hypothetical protein [Bifidobacterium cuniculi]|uniref:Riboflavin-specific deaminase n=1 Tax=Bifidobacterium cuniculi TaxID=1688 RepID=A0A087B2N7_9BIFI|nr:hypothetical protein [Bifidobacterium cuniculi]KFI65287.1 riboflavin-specific deaminase [Bifidobacterium cuniculi]
MTDLPLDQLTLDTADYLEALDGLIDAFEHDRATAAAAHRLFGPSSWCRVLAMAQERGDRLLREHGLRFLHRCRRTVTERGLAAWLLFLVNDADAVLNGQRNVEWVPSAICTTRASRAEQRLRKDPRHRFGGRRERDVILVEHSMECYRVAAVAVANWGSPARAATRTAYRLLTMPFLGRDLLECAARTCADCSFEERCAHCRSRQPVFAQLVTTLEGLRLQADAEYVQAEARGEVTAELGDLPRTTTERALDTRFLYDQRMLLDAYEALWEEETPTRNDMLLSYDYPDNLKEYEDLPLWRNPLYLYEVGASVMGGPMRQQLVNAFDARDRRVFDMTVASVRTFGCLARDMGALVLPAALINATMRGGSKARKDETMMVRTASMFRDAATIMALERTPFGEGIGFADTLNCFAAMDADGYLRLVEPVCARPFELLQQMGSGKYGGLNWSLAS